MNATAISVRQSTLVDAVLAYHAAVMAQAVAYHTSEQLLSTAYLSVESAVSALEKAGTMLAELAQLRAIAHGLAPGYERHRQLIRQLSERTRIARSALGYERSVASNLFALADEIGDDDEEAGTLATKVRDVAEMIDAEDFS